jgi:hypothetical protein
MIVLAFTWVMVVLLSFGIGSLVIWAYIVVLRKRLLKLQRAVETEYTSYRVNRSVL